MSGSEELVTITDVTLRDGLQIQPAVVDLDTKLAVLAGLSAAGVRSFEVGSFVNPAVVPQMADTAALFGAMPRRPDTSYAALVPNLRGARLAVDAGVTSVRMVLSASEGHSQSNTRRSVAEGLQATRAVVEFLAGERVAVSAAVATAFVCPFDGVTPVERVEQIVGDLLGMGLTDFVLADTIGRADPAHVGRLTAAVLACFPEATFGLHLHNTYGMALAGVVSGLKHGITRFDSALGGIGGCPFAPGAAGNVATEDVVHMLESMGHPTGIELGLLADVAATLHKGIRAPLDSSVARALAWVS